MSSVQSPTDPHPILVPNWCLSVFPWKPTTFTRFWPDTSTKVVRFLNDHSNLTWECYPLKILYIWYVTIPTIFYFLMVFLRSLKLLKDFLLFVYLLLVTGFIYFSKMFSYSFTVYWLTSFLFLALCRHVSFTVDYLVILLRLGVTIFFSTLNLGSYSKKWVVQLFYIPIMDPDYLPISWLLRVCDVHLTFNLVGVTSRQTVLYTFHYSR